MTFIRDIDALYSSGATYTKMNTTSLKVPCQSQIGQADQRNVRRYSITSKNDRFQHAQIPCLLTTKETPSRNDCLVQNYKEKLQIDRQTK